MSALKTLHTDETLTISFDLLPQKNLTKFLLEMVTKWTLPGKKLEPLKFFLTSSEGRAKGEIILPIVPSEWEIVSANFPVLRDEILYGTKSPYHASRMLEMKGLFGREKMELVQDRLTDFMTRRPDLFDYDLFGAMHRFAYETSEPFRAGRDVRYLARLVAISYLMQKKGGRFAVKLIQTKLELPLGTRHTVGIFTTLSSLSGKEHFSKDHLLKAVRAIIPDAALVDDAAIEREKNAYFSYVEIGKRSGAKFSLSEVQKLKRHLQKNLKNYIESEARPLFLPRNDEETFRKMRALAGELKYKRDLPQIAIDFVEQRGGVLIFTLLVAHIETGTPAYKKLAEVFSLERVRQVGLLRRRFPKKVAKFQAKLPLDPFIRPDESVDIVAARAALLSSVQEIIGPVRDYNGGLLAKDAETLAALQKLIAPDDPYDLETFFHAIRPAEYRSIVPKNVFARLYTLKNSPEKIIEEIDDTLIVHLPFDHLPLRDVFAEKIKKSLPSSSTLFTLKSKTSTHYTLSFLATAESRQLLSNTLMKLNKILLQSFLHTTPFQERLL